jgi:O-antigen ligase
VGLVALITLVVAIIPTSYGQRLASFRNGKSDDSLYRRSLYIVFGAEILAHRPLTGVGPGAFQYVMDTDYQRRFPMRLRSEGAGRTRGRAAHNMYLEIACELGLAGAITFGWLFWFTFKELRGIVGRARERGPPEFLALARSVEVAYWGFLTTSLFLSAEYRKYLWLLVAMSAVLRVLEPAAPGAPRSRRIPEPARPGGVRGAS